MASPKLTNAIRGKIIANVLAASYLKEQAIIDARMAAFHDNLYRSIVPNDTAALLAKVPKGYLLMQDECKVTLRPVVGKTEGYRTVKVKFAKSRPWPQEFSYGQGGHASPELCDIHDAILKAQESLDKMKEELRESVYSAVYAATTVAKLLDAWPEARQFIPADLAPKPKALLPVIMVDTLNAMIKKAGVNPFPAEPVAA